MMAARAQCPKNPDETRINAISAAPLTLTNVPCVEIVEQQQMNQCVERQGEVVPTSRLCVYDIRAGVHNCLRTQ
jgi:hypothetical protein